MPTISLTAMQVGSFSRPTETRRFPKGKVELVKIAGDSFGRLTLEPGWKWSTSVKPIVKTESCEMPHVNFHLSGRLMVKMDDGTQQEFSPGDISLIPPGHDAWVIGPDPVVMIDISGMAHYAER